MLIWRTSSYSGDNGGNCIEVAAAAWRKSSHSNSDGGNCVEVAPGFPGLVPVRDSKDPAGPVLVFPGSSWSAFVEAVRAGHLPLEG
ncbi:DUF397 domain-containing protein [Kitasatospora sp. NPDC048298]|uniref:DUF397 domain-containing protein n=1 Tax=Kitasatospora sp. NPDC048298 TaxID=3364049 RepID=UPI00371C7609